MTKSETPTFVKCIITLFIFSWIYTFLTTLINPFPLNEAFSEWMVNYEGGFVRRGFAGNIIYKLYVQFNIDPEVLIKIISSLSIILLTYLVYKTLKNNNLPIIYLCLPVIGLSTIYLFPWFSGYRKDPVLLVLCYFAFYFYKQHDKNQSIFSLLASQLCLILGLLLHEAFFFFSIPFLLFISCFPINKIKNLKTAFQTLFSWLPVIIVTILVFTNKGDKTVSNAIWSSWSEFVNNKFGSQTTLQQAMSIDALSWDTLKTIKMHFTYNFLVVSHGIPSILFLAYTIILIFYFFNNLTFKFKNLSKAENTYIYFRILILQFIFLSPLFLFLSCDYARLFVYLNISTLFIYNFFGDKLIDEQNIPKLINKMTISMYNLLNMPKISWIYNKKIYYFLMLIGLTYPRVSFSVSHAIFNTVLGGDFSFIKELIMLIK